MNITTFKKGETVIAYPSDGRGHEMPMTVKSVSDKYVSCVNEAGKVRKFNNDRKWFHNERMSYRLYHNMDEVHKEYENEQLIHQFREDVERNLFTPDEIRKFYEIHNVQ